MKQEAKPWQIDHKSGNKNANEDGDCALFLRHKYEPESWIRGLEVTKRTVYRAVRQEIRRVDALRGKANTVLEADLEIGVLFISAHEPD